MKKLLTAVLLASMSSVAFAADTMWPNKGAGIIDPTLVAKVETHPLEKHLENMNVNFALAKTDGVPARLIVMSGSPKQYTDVNFLCRMAEEYGGVNHVIAYESVDESEGASEKNTLSRNPSRTEKTCK